MFANGPKQGRRSPDKFFRPLKFPKLIFTQHGNTGNTEHTGHRAEFTRPLKFPQLIFTHHGNTGNTEYTGNSGEFFRPLTLSELILSTMELQPALLHLSRILTLQNAQQTERLNILLKQFKLATNKYGK